MPIRSDSVVRELAARWAVRLDAGDCSAKEMERLDAWLNADPSHRAALDAARDLWCELNVPALEAVRRPPSAPDTKSHRSLLWPSVAATVVLTIAAWIARDEWPIPLRADEWTGVGESRWVSLDDGSRVQLNTDSAISVDYSGRQRGVTLLKGEAAFEVAHDSSRPFQVNAAGGTVTALGTVFQLRIVEGIEVAAHVVVTEGRVQVRSGAMTEELGVGQQIVYSRRQLGARAAVDIHSAGAWRRGQLSFIEQPLGVVVAELDRYYPGRIEIANPALATRPVSGVFPTARPLDAVARSNIV